MCENEIMNILGNIRSKMFDILEGEELSKVLSIIDSKMEEYRGMSDLDIAKHLIDRSYHDFDGDVFARINLDEINENIDELKQKETITTEVRGE